MKMELNYPVYSPDGKNVLFTEMSGSSPSQTSSKLVAYNIASNRLVDLYTRGSVMSSCWVDNDSLVAFGEVNHTDNTFPLYLYNYRSGTKERISPDGYTAFAPVWLGGVSER